MTPTEKQKTLSEQSVYGDLILTTRDKNVRYKINAYSSTTDTFWYDENSNVRWGCISNSKIPVLRPLDLTKETTHKGYNNDQPFIPLVELANEARFLSTEIKFTSIEDNIAIARHEDSIFHFWYSDKGFMCEQINDKISYKGSLRVDHVKAFDLLNRLHFDSRNLLDSNEAISTDEVNPYEVK